MLIISRRVGERLVINTPQGDVWIRVTEIAENQVRLGIEAPKELAIYREELLGRIERKKKKSDRL